jgi:hypothetical protein
MRSGMRNPKPESPNPHEASMRIRSFIGAALLGLAMMAFAPVAMADPAPDICALDLSPPAILEYALEPASIITCGVLAVEVATAVPILPNGEDEPAAVCALTLPSSTDFDDYRLHVDPGRCLA